MSRPMDILIDAYLDGVTSEADLGRLDVWLLESDSHRRYFADRAYMDAQIGDVLCRDQIIKQIDLGREPLPFETLLSQEIQASAHIADLGKMAPQHEDVVKRTTNLMAHVDVSRPKVIVIPKLLFYGAIAAAVALTAMLFWPAQQLAPSSMPQVVEVKPTAPQLVQVAMLVEQVDAKWLGVSTSWDAPGSRAPSPGDALLNQPMYLVSGLAKLRFNNDAEVILEAPCSIEPISGGEIKITHGKLVGRCETAASKGFVVQTPGATIVDRGTEFGVSVDRAGVSNAHVFEGEIELNTTRITSPIILMRGQARQVDTAGTRISAIKTEESAFVRGEEFEANTKANQSPYHRWLAHSYKLRRDPDVAINWTFDSDSLSPEIPKRLLEAGRFGDKSAAVRIDFQRPVRFELNDPLRAVTLAGWYRIEDLQKTFITLVNTDGFDKVGQIHWQINTDGQFTCAQQAYNGALWWLSRPVFKQHNIGQWVFLAVTLDVDNSSVRFFLDGRDVPMAYAGLAHKNRSGKLENNEGRLSDDLHLSPLIFRGASVGVWGDPDPRFGEIDRTLKGAIDELVVYQRALTSAEIQALYEASKP